MKCLVTGGQGFIGRHVVTELVRRGLQVIVYDRIGSDGSNDTDQVRFVEGDIRDIARIQPILNHVSLVFHLAGVIGTSELFDNPKEAIDINIGGALNIFLCSSKISKAPKIFIPLKHTTTNNIYSMTAQGVEKLGHIYRENFDLDVRMLVVPNVYGPANSGHSTQRVVSRFIYQALRNCDIEIFGSGDQLVELIYASDVARVIVDYTIFPDAPRRTFELFARDKLSVATLARRIINMSDSKSMIVTRPRRRGEFVEAALVRAADVVELLGAQDLTDIETGMRNTISSYRMATMVNVS